jgi:hypothetical protein
LSATAGVCVHRPGSSLQTAAIGWAGVIGEALMNCPHKARTLPKTPLEKFSVCKWVDEIRLHQLSKEDRDGIAKHPARYQPAQVAFDILSASVDVLEYSARKLMERSRDRFAKSTVHPNPTRDELELLQFLDECNEANRTKEMEKALTRISKEAELIAANLPPLPVPNEFNFETFITATRASDDEIRDFCAFRILRERNQIGLGGVPERSLEAAINFFKESAIQSRDTWIYDVREFCAWRENRQPKE